MAVSQLDTWMLPRHDHCRNSTSILPQIEHLLTFLRWFFTQICHKKKKQKLSSSTVSPPTQHVLTSCLLRPVGHFHILVELFNTLISRRLRHAEAFIRCLYKRKHRGFISKTVTGLLLSTKALLSGSRQLRPLYRHQLAFTVLSARMAPKASCLALKQECSSAPSSCRRLDYPDGLRRCYQSDCKSAMTHSPRLTAAAGRNAQLRCFCVKIR